jgi:hypothetical protein
MFPKLVLILVTLWLQSAIGERKLPYLTTANGFGFYYSTQTHSLRQIVYIQRTLDIAPYFRASAQVLESGKQLQSFCRKRYNAIVLGNAGLNRINAKEGLNTPRATGVSRGFVAINGPLADRPTADSICQRQGMKLPEIMTDTQKGDLLYFLTVNDIKETFAGIYHHFPTMTKRFITSGKLMDKGAIDSYKLSNQVKSQYDTHDLHDEWQRVALYTDKGDLKFVPYYSEAMAQEYLTKTYHETSVVRKNKIAAWRWFGQQAVKKPVVCQLETSSPIETRVRDLEDHVSALVKPARNERIQEGINNLLEQIYARCLLSAANIRQDEKQMREQLIERFDVSGLTYVETETTLTKRKKRSFFTATLGPISAFGSALYRYQAHRKVNQRLTELELDQISLKNDLLDNTIALEELDLGMSQLKKEAQDFYNTTLIQIQNLEYRLSAVENNFLYLTDVLEMENGVLYIETLSHRARNSLKVAVNKLDSILAEISNGKMPVDLITSTEFANLRQRILERYHLKLMYDPTEMEAALFVNPSDNSQLIILASIPAVEPAPYNLVEIVPLPLFGELHTVEPAIMERYVAVASDSDHYFALSEAQYYHCSAKACRFSSPKRSMEASQCGIGRLVANKPEPCPIHMLPRKLRDFFLNLGESGIVYSIVNTCKITLQCNRVSLPVMLEGQGVLKLPSGCYGIASGTPSTQVVYLRGPESVRFLLLPETEKSKSATFISSGTSQADVNSIITQSDLLKGTVGKVKNIRQSITNLSHQHQLYRKIRKIILIGLIILACFVLILLVLAVVIFYLIWRKVGHLRWALLKIYSFAVAKNSLWLQELVRNKSTRNTMYQSAINETDNLLEKTFSVIEDGNNSKLRAFAMRNRNATLLEATQPDRFTSTPISSFRPISPPTQPQTSKRSFAAYSPAPSGVYQSSTPIDQCSIIDVVVTPPPLSNPVLSSNP